MIHVEIVKPAPGTIGPFIRLTDAVYRGDPNHVAMSRRELVKLLTGKDNELFSQGIQRFFLAYDDDKPVARVLAGIDLRRNAQTGLHEGYFSLFESYDNIDYARAVLDAASAFLKEHGITAMYGPVAPYYTDLTRGLLVEGFDGPPVLFNPYNPPYYAELLKEYGFEKERDYLAYMMDSEDMQSAERFAPLYERVQQRFGFRVRNLDLNKQSLPHVAQDIASVIAEAAPEEPGQYLPTGDDMLSLLKRIKRVYRPELAVMAYAGSRPIGVMIAIPDYNRVLKARRGRNDPISLLLGEFERSRIDTARCPMQYVVPDYQNKAVNAAMLYQAWQGAKRLRIRRMEGSTVDETHLASVNNSSIAGGKRYRAYRMYSTNI